MSAIRTTAAASMLGVSASTLRSWERRFGYPTPARSSGGHRHYELAEIEALRAAFEEVPHVSSAISVARERGAGPSTPARLGGAFAAYDEERANRLLEESLAVRSVERTIDELLLPALARLAPGGTELELGWRHATGWLSAQRRLAPAATRPEGVLIFDASAPFELEALHVQGLEVAVRRAGLRTLTLSTAIDPSRLGRALRVLQPAAVVFGGAAVAPEVAGHLARAVRTQEPGPVVADFRGALAGLGASTVPRLGDTVVGARDALLGRVIGPT